MSEENQVDSIENEIDSGQTGGNDEELKKLLAGFNLTQMRFLIARMDCNSNAEAAKKIGIRPATVTDWGPDIRRAMYLMKYDGVITALEMQRKALPRAMAVKVGGLESQEERIAQASATEIIERELGKPVQRNENKLSGETVVRVVRDAG